MRVDLFHSGPSALEGKKPSGKEKCQECTALGSLEFSKVLDTMLKELSELKKEEDRRSSETRQDLVNFIQSVEKADEKFRTAQSDNVVRLNLLPDGEYLLYVSVIDVFKAQIEVVRAYHILCRERPTKEKLLLVGPKYSKYEKAGELEYWIVDPSERVIEVYVLAQKAYKIMGKWGTGETAYSKVLAGFQASVDDVFGG